MNNVFIADTEITGGLLHLLSIFLRRLAIDRATAAFIISDPSRPYSYRSISRADRTRIHAHERSAPVFAYHIMFSL